MADWRSKLNTTKRHKQHRASYNSAKSLIQRLIQRPSWPLSKKHKSDSLCFFPEILSQHSVNFWKFDLKLRKKGNKSAIEWFLVHVRVEVHLSRARQVDQKNPRWSEPADGQRGNTVFGTVGFILRGPPALAMRFTAFKLNALVFESACDTHSRKLLEPNITLCQSSFCKPVSTSAALKKTKTSSKCGEFLSNKAILNYAVCMISLLEYFFLMHNMLAETALKENKGAQLVRFIFELENLAFHAAVLEADVEPVYWWWRWRQVCRPGDWLRKTTWKQGRRRETKKPWPTSCYLGSTKIPQQLHCIPGKQRTGNQEKCKERKQFCLFDLFEVYTNIFREKC